MADVIKGLTLKIGADTKDFENALKAADKDIKATNKQVNALSKSLSFKWDDKKFTEAQKLAQKALTDTEEKAAALRKQLEQLETTGQKDSTNYKEFQAELEKTETEAGKLEKKLKEIENLKFTSVGNQIKAIGSGLDAAGRALTPLSVGAGAVVGGLGKLAREAAATGAEIDDLSLRFGVSAEKVQEWQYLAVQAGVDVEVFNKALIKTRAAMLDLSTGKTNEQAKAIAELGLSMEQFDSNEAMFDGVIDALAKMEDKTRQAALANEIFGDKIANQMLPYINMGADEIKKFKDEFASFDSLSNEQVSALAKMDDMLFRMKETFRNLGLQIGSALMPVFQSFVQLMEEKAAPLVQRVAEFFKSLSDEQQEFAVKALLVVAALAPLLMILGKITTGVGSLIQIIPKLIGVLDVLKAHPIIAVIGVVIGLLAVLYASNEKFRESIKSIFQSLSKMLLPVFSVLANLLETVFGLIGPLIEMMSGPLIEAIAFVAEGLKPLAEALAFIVDLANKALDALGFVFGKGWLWGKDDGGSAASASKYEFPDYSFPDITIPALDTGSYSSSSVDNSVTNVTVNAAENQSPQEIAEEVMRQLARQKMGYS